jgi:hypothetical protein
MEATDSEMAKKELRRNERILEKLGSGRALLTRSELESEANEEDEMPCNHHDGLHQPQQVV